MTPPSDETRIPLDHDRTAMPAAPVADAVDVRLTPGASTQAGAEPAGLALPIGTRLNEFEITGVIGEGGFGIVYAAHDHSLDRDVALKEYMPAALALRTQGVTVSVRSERHRETFQLGLKSFVNEARLLARFDHPSLVKVYRFWEAHGTAYMVMPQYHGETLKARIKKPSSTPPDEAWLRRLLMSVMDALEVIHQENVFHRDIAPDNIMLLEDDVPVLLDFGAARRVIGDATQGLTVILKPGYAPIEQYAEVKTMKQGAWTDVYALAATMHFAITGKAPEPAVARMLNDNLVPLAEAARGRFSATFLAALDAGLQVKPEARPQNVAALRGLLGAAPGAVPSSTSRAQRAAKPAASADAGHRASRLPLFAGSVAVLAMLGAGAYFYWSRGVTTGDIVPVDKPLAKPEPQAPSVEPPVQTTAVPPKSEPTPTAAPVAPAPEARVEPPVVAVPPPLKEEAVPPVAPAQKPAVAAKPVAPKPPLEEPKVARVEPKPPAAKPPTVPTAPDLGQEAYRQPPPERDNVQVTALVTQAQQSLTRREFRRAMGLADNALALDPYNTQARDIRRRAQEGEKRAFEEIKIE